MFEYNGFTFSIEEMIEKANNHGLTLEELLEKNPDIKKIEQSYNEGLTPNFQTPTGPSAPVEVNTALELDSNLDPGSSASAKQKIKVAQDAAFKTVVDQLIPSKTAKSIIGGGVGVGGFITEFVPGLVDYAERLAPIVTGGGRRRLLAETLYEMGMQGEDDPKNIGEIFKQNLLDQGEGIDFSPIYEAADQMYRAKDLISGTFDEEGNKMGVVELLEKGEVANAATSAIADAITSAPSLILSYAFPVFGSAALGASQAGKEFNTRLEEGEEDLATIYAGSTLYGLAEFGTEFAGAKLLRFINGAKGAGMGKEVINDFAREGADKYMTFLLKGIGKFAAGFAGEGTTEAATASLQGLTDKLVYENDDFQFRRDWREIADAFIIGGLLGGPVTGSTDFANRIKISNNKELIYNFIAPEAQQQKLNKLRSDIGALEQRKKKYKQPARQNKVQLEIDAKKEELNVAEQILHGRFNTLTKSEIVTYYDNNEYIRNNFYDLKSPKFTKEEKLDIKKEINRRAKENQKLLGDGVYNADIELGIQELLTDNQLIGERVQKLKGVNKDDLKIVKFTDSKSKQKPKQMNEDAGLFLDEKAKTPTLYINMEKALEQKATNVLGHELLHYVFSRSFKTDNASMMPLVQSFKDYLRQSEEGTDILNRIEYRIEKHYTKKDGTLKDGAAEEYFTIFSDIISKRKITLNESKIGGIVRNLKNTFNRLVGASNVQLNSGEDIVNFLRNYNDNVNRKNKLLNYTLTTTIDGVKLSDNKQSINKKSINQEITPVNERELSEQIDGYINDSMQTNSDFVQKGGLQGTELNIRTLGTLDGYLRNLIIEDGKIPPAQIESALQKIKDRLLERIEKNYEPVKDGSKRSLFSYIFGSAASKGKGGIAFRSLQDIKAEVAKAPKTVPVQKQTSEGVQEIQIIDDAGIEVFVDRSLNENIDNSIPSSIQNNLTVLIYDKDGKVVGSKKILDSEGEIAQLVRDTAVQIQQELIAAELDPADPNYKKEYTKIVKKNSKAALKKFREALNIKSKSKYEDFLRENFPKTINNPKALNISYFVQAERETTKKLFAKEVRRLTKQNEIREAVEDGLAYVENEADGVRLYKKERVSINEGLPFFLEGERIDGKKTALVTAMFMQAVSDATPSILEAVGYTTGQKNTILKKIQRLEGQKFSKGDKLRDLPQDYQQTIANFSDGYADFQNAMEDLINKLEILSKENPNFDAKKFLKNKVGQAAELFFAKQLPKSLAGVKVTNISELKELTTGDTGVDVEIEYKGKTVGIEVKLTSGAIMGSFTKTDNNILAPGDTALIENISEKLKQNILTQLEKIGVPKNEIKVEDNKIKFPKFYKGKRVLDSIERGIRSEKINVDNSELIRQFYIQKGLAKGKSVDYMYFFDVGLFSLTNDPLNLGAPDISTLKMDSKVYATYKSTDSKGGIETLTRTVQLNLTGNPATTGPKYNNFKSKRSIDTKKRNLNKDFNNILEKKTGIEAFKEFSGVKGRRRGKQKGQMNFFVPYGAEDFQGLMYATLPKGKDGNAAMEWMRQTFFRPYSLAMENMNKEQMAVMNDFKELKKQLKNTPSTLKKKILNGDFTNQDAVRVWIWNQQGMDIPGLSKADQKALVDVVNNNKDLKDFSINLMRINKSDGYIKPDQYWDAGTITTDLFDNLNTVKREKYLQEWQNNVNEVFDEAMYNKLASIYGEKYVRALKNILTRMRTGRNRTGAGNPQIDAWLDWVNNSVGTIMFLNVRSAVLQTISTVNYMNWSDNNPLKAAKAFANQKQFWSDFNMIFNSDYLVQRRGGLKLNIAENEIADAASKGGIRGAISYLLNKGFVLTRGADSFAIASGGASFYRNRLNSYLKQGMDQKEAEQKAFSDFREITEESQQSSRPDRISMEQASGFGRLILAFANTPMQYTRLMKRSAQDIINRRGDWKTNWSKLIYYGTVQNFIFNALQKALFALGVDEDEEEKRKQKYTSIAEGMLDSILRGTGVGGNVVMVGKNVAVDIARRAKKDRPNFKDAAWKLLDISPPIDSKITKLRSAGYTFDYQMNEIKDAGISLENPAAMASAQIISATTNVPLDRVIRLYDNYRAAVATDTEAWQRVALILGWSSWELGIEDESTKLKQNKVKKEKTGLQKTREKIRKSFNKNK